MLVELATTTRDRLDHARRLVPVRSLPALAERRVGRAWLDPGYRQVQEDHMRYLLEHTERAAEVPYLARKFAEHSMIRAYLRWHPSAVLRQEIRGIDWLTTRRDPDRSIILSFMHHNKFDGLFGSLARAGAPTHVLVSPLVLGADALTAFKQHVRLVGRGGTIVPAEGGTAAIETMLRPGMIFAIASDVPGHTEVTFLGRRVLASYGAALIATRTNSQVVLATAHREGDGSYVQVHEPLEPADFANPADLLQEMVRRHGEAVLAWPEALDNPLARWGVVPQ